MKEVTVPADVAALAAAAEGEDEAAGVVEQALSTAAAAGTAKLALRTVRRLIPRAGSGVEISGEVT